MKIVEVVSVYAASPALREELQDELGRMAYGPAWRVGCSCTRDWCGGYELRITHPPEINRISDRLREIILADHAAIGAGVTCKVTVDGVRAVYAVEAVNAEYAVNAVAVCCFMMHGMVPWRSGEGVEADGSSIARVFEHGIVPWRSGEGVETDGSSIARMDERGCDPRGVEGVEAGRRLDVQDRCGDVHVGLVAVAVTKNEDGECILRWEWLWSQDLEDPVMAVDVAASWMQSRRQIDKARRCGGRPAPSKCVGAHPSCCSRYRACRCVHASSVRGCVGKKTAPNMYALRAYWSVGCYMYRYYESLCSMVQELVEGAVLHTVCVPRVTR